MAGKKRMEDIDYMMARQQIKQHIQAAIKKTMALAGGSRFKTVCGQFLNCIEPEKVPGTNPLPLIAGPNNRCRTKSKYEHILYMISYLIQHFHELTSTNSLVLVVIKSQLHRIETILDKRLKAYEVCGSKYPGYYLQEKK